MAPKELQNLAKRIEALPERDKLKLLKRVLTPEMELALVLTRMRQKSRGHDPRAIDRAVDRAVKDVRRRGRASRGSS